MSSRLFKTALAAAVLAASAAPASAYWIREDWLGLQAETHRFRVRFLDFAAYESVTGLGIGTEAFEAVSAPLDIPRIGRNDATAYALYEFLPLKGYLALASWKGPTYWHATEIAADRSIGKLELYGSFCDWGTLTEFKEGGDFGRQDLSGSLRTRIVEYGARVDQGLGDSFALAGSIGRRELTVYADGPFLGRRTDEWYAAAELYFGVTKGSDYGGGLGRLFLMAADQVRALFGGSVVHRKSLPSTTP